jgi:hypothetical protein
MDTVGDLVARERRTDDVALAAPGVGRTMRYHDLCTTAWKAGNALRHFGVARGATVAVAADPHPTPVLGFLGAALLGARTRFADSVGTGAHSEGTSHHDGAPRAALVPARDADREAPPGTSLVAYGDAPDRPTVAHWEGTVWSENPAFPPTAVDPGTAVLAPRHSHEDVLAAARDVVAGAGLDAGERVAVRAPLSDPRGVVAGVVAPLLAGGAVLFPAGDAVGDVAVVRAGDREAPEATAVSVEDVSLGE